MAMTMTEKVLARHAGKAAVQPGQNVWCDVDVLMTHDICGPGTIGVFEQKFGKDAKVFDREKIVIVPDHYIFTADPKAHRNLDTLRDFVKRQGITHFYDADFVKAAGMPEPYARGGNGVYRGVCHVALPQNGHTRPGELLLGTDSHTCTHGAFGEFATGIGNTEAGFVMGTGKLWLKVPQSIKFVLKGRLAPHVMAKDVILHIIGMIGVDGATYAAMEFAGEGVSDLGIDERMTICNMAIEAGGKNGIIAADKVTLDFIRGRTSKPFEAVASDAGAKYAKVHELDAAKIEPTVAKPHSPDNHATARELKATRIDRVYIGSCTGGKITDFAAAAGVLAGRQVKVDTFIVPATVEVDNDLDMVKQGGKTLREIFAAAGCKIGPASCAACLGGPVDTFGRANEALAVVSTTNRNFPGRMGHKEAGVYLASPLTAAASALTGHVTDPRDVMSQSAPIGRAR